MPRFPVFMALLATGLAAHAHADAFRPGGAGSGGRTGKVCISDYLSEAERASCVEKMKAAQNDAERAEIRDLIRHVVKAREKDAQIRRDNANAGGPRR